MEARLGESTDLLRQPRTWLQQAADTLHGDPGQAINSVKGVNDFLDANRDRIAQLERRAQALAAAEQLVEAMDTIMTDCPDIVNPGIQ